MALIRSSRAAGVHTVFIYMYSLLLKSLNIYIYIKIQQRKVQETITHKACALTFSRVRAHLTGLKEVMCSFALFVIVNNQFDLLQFDRIIAVNLKASQRLCIAKRAREGFLSIRNINI